MTKNLSKLLGIYLQKYFAKFFLCLICYNKTTWDTQVNYACIIGRR